MPREGLREFTVSTLPDPRLYEDSQAVLKRADGSNSVLLSDGKNWLHAIAQNPVTGKMYGADGEIPLLSREGVLWEDPVPEGFVGLRFVRNVGVTGSLWYHTGATRSLVGGACILGQSAVAVSCSASTAEEVLQTVNLPAGVMGLNGALRLTTLWSITSSANNKTLRARIGTTALGGSAWIANVATTVGSLNLIPQVLRNRNAANSQVTYPAANAGATVSTGTAISTFTEDTSGPMVVAITGQKASAGETITLEGYTLELLR